MRYQFQIDNRAAGPIRRDWDTAAQDAVAMGYGTWIEDGVKLDDQASILRIKSDMPIAARSVVDLPPCIIRQAGDSTFCAADGCGLRWDTNDPEPPGCPRSRVSLARLGREAQRRIAPYSEPRRREKGIWVACVALAIAGAYLLWDLSPRIVAALIVLWLTL